jgi:hypothetical protein
MCEQHEIKMITHQGKVEPRQAGPLRGKPDAAERQRRHKEVMKE